MDYTSLNNLEIKRTKLFHPLLLADHISRQRLLDMLDQHCHLPITIVSSPGGYGKSTLINSWLQKCEYPNAWFSLDENDNDLRLFLIYFVKAIQNIFPDFGGKTLALGEVPNLPSLSKMAASLVNELSEIKKHFVLVLDDYQSIREQSVHDLLTELLRHPPPSMHLVLISRREPPLPIATYRAKGQLTEIGAPELCFTLQETEAFLQKALRREIDHAAVMAWHEKTEGWVTGLQLAALGMRHKIKTDDIPLTSIKDTKYAREYFYNEVFSTQSPEIQHCLMTTAILDRFNAPLCEAVSRSDDKPEHEVNGWKFISWLKKENLFLISLDAENGWYRYHHLFQQLLLNQLERNHSNKEIYKLHLRASNWFVENGLVEEALQHALAACDTKRAIQLVGQAGFQLMENQEWARLQRWLHMLPHEELEQSPELLILQAWIFQVQHNRLDTFAYLDKVEALKATSQPEALDKCNTIKGYFETLNAFRLYMATDGQRALRHSRVAIDNLSNQQKRALVLAHVTALASHQMLGDVATGLNIYKVAMKDPAIKDSDYYSMFMAYLCFIYWIEADLFSFQQAAEAALLHLDKKYLPENAAFANYFRGIGHYCLNELDSAEKRLLKVVHTNIIHNSMIFAHSSFALALVYQAKNEPDKAGKYCDAVMTHAIEISNDVILGFSQAFKAELALRKGRLAEASKWAKQFQAQPFKPPYLFYMPQLTLVKTLMAQDTEESLQQASDLLDELHAYLVSIHNKVFLIEVLALQALLCDKHNMEQAALDKLRKAIILAAPSGFIRRFVDKGLRMAVMLKQLEKEEKNKAYIRKILAVFKNGKDMFSPILLGLNIEPFSTKLPLQMIESLTSREIEILKFIAKRFHNREIAENLYISPETVKTHLRNIYTKLEVGGRQEAVSKARELGFFSSA